jgi:hypothetical protein
MTDARAGREQADLAEHVTGAELSDDLAALVHVGVARLDHEQLVGVVALARERGARLDRHVAHAGGDLGALVVREAGEQGICARRAASMRTRRILVRAHHPDVKSV